MGLGLELTVVGEQTIHGAGCDRTVEFTLSQVPGMRAVKARREWAEDTEDQRAAAAHSSRSLDHGCRRPRWAGCLPG